MGQVLLRRVQELPEPDQGARVLVDRTWPRGLAKQPAQLSEWLKAVAPSTELWRWFGHTPERFTEFARRYLDELGLPEQAEAMAHLRRLAGAGDLTILTASSDLSCCHGTVLLKLLTRPAGGAKEEGGDPACWLHLICPGCGALVESEARAVCPRCQALLG